MIARIAQAAVARWIVALAQAAAEELPEGATAEPVEGGVRLSGPGLARRWLAEADLRGFAITAARRLR